MHSRSGKDFIVVVVDIELVALVLFPPWGRRSLFKALGGGVYSKQESRVILGIGSLIYIFDSLQYVTAAAAGRTTHTTLTKHTTLTIHTQPLRQYVTVAAAEPGLLSHCSRSLLTHNPYFSRLQ